MARWWVGALNYRYMWFQVVALILVFWAATQFALAEQNDVQPSSQSESERLRGLVRQVQVRVDTAETEAELRKALLRNERLLDTLQLRFGVVASLITIYERQSRWKEAEKLYETYGQSFWLTPHVEEKVAELLMKQGKYADARVILGKFVPQLKPPGPDGFCGVPYMHYANLKQMYKTCCDKTRGTSLAHAEREREERVAQYWKELQEEAATIDTTEKGKQVESLE